MTENEAINHINLMCHCCVCWYGEKCHEDGYCFETMQIAIQALEEIQQYRAIGTIEEFKAIKSDGFTDHLLNMGYTKGYRKAIDKFAEKLKNRLIVMQIRELRGKDVCPCAKTGEECPYINQDIGCQYCAREHTIQEVDEIAEQMKGGGNDVETN